MAAKGKITLPVVPGKSIKARATIVLRYGIYIVLVIVLIRGIVSIFQSNETAAPILSNPLVLSDGAQSFAEAFASSYYSYNPKKSNGSREDYYSELSGYLAQGLSKENVGLNFKDSQGIFQARQTFPWKLTQINENRADIDVRVMVDRTDMVSGEKESFTRYLRVPILATNEGFVVNDIPTTLPEPIPAQGVVASLPELDQQSEDSMTADIKTALEDFFVAYSSDSPSKIRYFMADGKEINGYEGAYVFNNIQTLRVFLPKEGSSGLEKERIVYVDSEWTDQEGFTQLQHHTISLIFKEERWYIKQFAGGYQP